MSDELKAMRCSITGGTLQNGVIAELKMPKDFKLSPRVMVVMEAADYDALRKELEEAKAIVDLARELRKVDGSGRIFNAIKCADAGEKLDAALNGSESK